MRQENIACSFERITIDVAGPFLESDDGKWAEAYAFPKQEAATSEFRWNYTQIKAGISNHTFLDCLRYSKCLHFSY